MIDFIFTISKFVIAFFFGIFLSCAFTGIQYTKKNVMVLIGFSSICSLLLSIANMLPSQLIAWKILPLIIHIPNLLLLYFYYHKPLSISIAAICTSFLLCQPPKWIYTLLLHIIPDNMVIKIILFVTLFILTFLIAYYLSKSISKLYTKDNKSVYIFGSVPILYYVTNYFLETHTGFWSYSDPMITEFFRFFLCIVFLVFCVAYHKEYEQKADLECKEQIINIFLEQQKKEMENIKEKEHELRIIRHDMRLFLNTIIIHLNENDTKGALKLISSLSSNIDATKISHYCSNDTINYIISDYASKCEKASISLQTTIQLDELKADEIMFVSILSNALDNALNATLSLPTQDRVIKLLLKTSNDKLLLSVKNYFDDNIIFSDGLPVSNKPGHGYGTQSIRYMTERIGGKCQFTIERNEFILRVVI